MEEGQGLLRKPIRNFLHENRAQSVMTSKRDIHQSQDPSGSSPIEAITTIRTSIETFQSTQNANFGNKTELYVA